MLPNGWSFDLFVLVDKWCKRLNDLGYKTDREETFLALTVATGILLGKYPAKYHSLCSLQIVSDILLLTPAEQQAEVQLAKVLINKYLKSGMRPKATALYKAAKQELTELVQRSREFDNHKSIKGNLVDSSHNTPHTGTS